MRKIFTYIIISLFISTNYGQFFQPLSTENKISTFANDQNKLYLKQSASVDNSTDIIYQRLEFKINPLDYFITGKVTSYFKSLTNVQNIYFDMSDSLIVDSVIFRNQKFSWQHAADIIHVDFNHTIPENSIDSLSIYYHGQPIGSGNYSFIQDYHNDIPIIYTHSEPYGSKYWWPCRQNLSDKIDSIDLLITTPDPYFAVSNGVLISITGNSEKTFHWKHRFPISTYLVAFAVTEYEKYTDTAILDNGKIIEIQNFIYPENVDSIKNLTPALIPVMKFYSEKFSIYPFQNEKYGHAQTSLRGGMENQTISFMGFFNYELMAHELAHQWFGDYITCKSWQDIWLNEGFATYLTGLSLENLGSNEVWDQWKQVQIKSITEYPNGSVWVDDTTSENRIFNHRLTYEKGAYLLHMLRWELKDSLFFQGLNNYLNDPDLANNFASTQDLKTHFEQVADTNLTEFFKDWFYGEGYPKYTIFWMQNTDQTINLEIYQESSDKSVNFFEMNIPLLLIGENQNKIIKINHKENGQKINIPVDFMVKRISFDPDRWILTNRANIIKGTSKQNEIFVYPNPFSDEIHVIALPHIKIENISIYTISGDLLFSTNNERAIIQTTNFQKGIYILKVKTSNAYYERKLVKFD